MSTSRGLGRGLGSLIPQRSRPAAPSVVATAASAVTSGGEGLRRVPVASIAPNPQQPRVHFAHGDLDDLIASIKRHGILQPLVVTEKSDGMFELISGERRLRASTMAGLTEVPVIIRTAEEQEKLELALIENIQRADLNAIEEARAYRKLMDDYGLTQEMVADRLGKSRPQIANTLRLLNLPETMQQAVRDGQISASAARTLVAVQDPKLQEKLWKKLLTEGMSVRDVEQAVRSKSTQNAKDPNLTAAEAALRESLGTRVDIQKRGAAGKISIAFFSDDELNGLLERLEHV